MKVTRLGLAVVGVVLALALPAVGQANEVTNWNTIALNTVLAQPPIGSSPNAAAVFMAMTQGAVYGAVNAIDRHGRPYLVQRRFPMASLDAAVATAAYRVLDTTFSGQHATLKAQYDISLGNIPDGSLKDTGVEVGEAAAAAMLAQGHDARAAVPCWFGSFVPGVWQPLADATVLRSATRAHGCGTRRHSWSTARRNFARQARTRLTAPRTPMTTTRSKTSGP